MTRGRRARNDGDIRLLQLPEALRTRVFAALDPESLASARAASSGMRDAVRDSLYGIGQCDCHRALMAVLMSDAGALRGALRSLRARAVAAAAESRDAQTLELVQEQVAPDFARGAASAREDLQSALRAAAAARDVGRVPEALVARAGEVLGPRALRRQVRVAFAAPPQPEEPPPRGAVYADADRAPPPPAAVVFDVRRPSGTCFCESVVRAARAGDARAVFETTQDLRVFLASVASARLDVTMARTVAVDALPDARDQRRAELNLPSAEEVAEKLAKGMATQILLMVSKGVDVYDAFEFTRDFVRGTDDDALYVHILRGPNATLAKLIIEDADHKMSALNASLEVQRTDDEIIELAEASHGATEDHIEAWQEHAMSCVAAVFSMSCGDAALRAVVHAVMDGWFVLYDEQGDALSLTRRGDAQWQCMRDLLIASSAHDRQLNWILKGMVKGGGDVFSVRGRVRRIGDRDLARALDRVPPGFFIDGV